MNPTDIFEALEAIAMKPFDPAEFGFAFAEATDNAKATVSKLRTGATNYSDLTGGLLLNRKFHYLAALPGDVRQSLEALRTSKRTAARKPAILIATDGDTVAAEHVKSGDTLHCAFSEIADNFGFFLPAAGKDRYTIKEENKADVKASLKLAKLYDALVRVNPDWGTSTRRHDMNQFMTRLIFCMFAEDVGIFPDKCFSALLFNHAGNDGEEARTVLVDAFEAMNREKSNRNSLPAWTHELDYVNGGLFAGSIEAPEFDKLSFRYLREACDLDWKEINPDIFGSMIQSVADPAARAELGMHYTSVPNIMKALGPLFLDDLDAAIEKAWDRPNGLRKVLDRIAGIRVFDPACGSGNFLVVAYRELRLREIRIFKRLQEIERQSRIHQSGVLLRSFHGIEINDFAAETAKLSLFIAQYQAMAQFDMQFGQDSQALPLSQGAHIVTGNALRLDWDMVCPPPKDGEEVFVAGNPPFLGSNFQSRDQKSDLSFVFSEHVNSYAAFDFVSAWFFKMSFYIHNRNASGALVSTNSICQGYSVGSLWPHVLHHGVEVGFAHRSFKWRNNASANAAVICVIVGLRNRSSATKILYEDGIATKAANINAYLVDAQNIVVAGTRSHLFGLPAMDYGNKPADGGNLILSREERDAIIEAAPEAAIFIKRYMGSQEVVRGVERYCLWIKEAEYAKATSIPMLHQRIESVRRFRLNSTKEPTRRMAERPYEFDQIRIDPSAPSILVPRVTSERRPYLPVCRVGADVISSDLNQVLYDAPEWCIALIASKLHLVWIGTVCGKLKSDYRYSNTLGWNTFPVPKFTQAQLDALTASARSILKVRYAHHPKTIAELYDPDKMPDDLRAAHAANDALLEGMYIGRPFRNDTERLEHLFKLYAARIRKTEKEVA